MIDLNKLAAELHEAAVEKGFWAVDEAEIKHIAKMHSELSEALQEDRAGMPMLYVDDVTLDGPITDPAMFDGRKPEGVAAELADFVMMVLDWARARDMMIVDFSMLEFRSLSVINNATLPKLVNDLHECIVSMSKQMDDEFELYFDFIPLVVHAWLDIHGVDLFHVIRLKMEYNKSRPALHGRKY